MTAAVTHTPSSDAPPTTGQPVRDAELLRRFVRRGDEEAFAELVERHSRLVVGVCRRVLHCEHDIEDAFQATFLVLARDAARIRKLPSLASWLHGVAYRTSLRAIDSSSRRRRLLRDLAMNDETETIDADAFALLEERQQRLALDEELAELPDNHRAPLVLHYLEGKTNQQVADELGTTLTAVEGRLKRGKKELRLRLARRGIGLSVAVAAMHAVQSSVSASTLNPLIARTIDAGLSYAGGQPPGPVFTPEAARLAGQEILAMSTTTAATLTAALLVPLVLAIPGDVSLAGGDRPSAAVSTEVAAGGEATNEAASVTASVAATPDSSTLGLGSALEQIAERHHVNILLDKPALKKAGISADEPVEVPDSGSLSSDLSSLLKPLNLIATLEDDVFKVTTRIRLLQNLQRPVDAAAVPMPASSSDSMVAQTGAEASAREPADYSDTDAERMRETANTARPLSPVSDIVDYADIPQSVMRIEHELDKQTRVEFVDTPLSEAIEYFSQLHNIPILLDETALSDLGVATDEPTNLVLPDVQLRSALNLLLRPRGLTAIVRDEVMTVTTKEKADDYLETRVYSTRNLGDISEDRLVKLLEDATVETHWQSRDGLGGTISGIDGGLVIKQSQSGHEQVANLLSQLRRKHLAEQQAGSMSINVPAAGNATFGFGMGFGNRRQQPQATGATSSSGTVGGRSPQRQPSPMMQNMGMDPTRGTIPGMMGTGRGRGAAEKTPEPLPVPTSAVEKSDTPSLVIYDVDELAASLVPKPEQAGESTEGGGFGGGGGGIDSTGILKNNAINTISQIFQMGAMKSDIPFSSERLPDGTIAVMTTPEGHRIVEETLETLREHAKKPRTGRAFPSGGGFF